MLGSLAVATVGFAFGHFIPSLAGYSAIGHILVGTSGLWLAIVAATAILYQTIKPTQIVAAMGGVPYGRALAADLASTAAANALPAGGAVGVGFTYVMFRSWGHSASRIAAMVAATGVWDLAFKLAAPIVAVALAAASGQASTALVSAALTGAGALALIAIAAASLRRPALRQRLAKLAGRAAAKFTRSIGTGIATPGEPTGFAGGFLKAFPDHWRGVAAATVAANVSLFLVLLSSLRAVGVESSSVAWPEVFGAVAIMRLVTAIPVSPGGLGIAEASLTALLLHGQAQPMVEPTIAAVLLFRFLTLILPTLGGAIVAFIWKTGRPRSGRHGDIGGGRWFRRPPAPVDDGE